MHDKLDARLADETAYRTTRGFITPDVAAVWLERNTHNRRLRVSHAARMAADMRAGKWAQTGQVNVTFSRTGVLLDGQHTLSAVVSSGLPLLAVVVTGVDDDAQSFIDTGVPRQFKDALALQGVMQASHVASIARQLYTYDNTASRASNSNSKIAPTVAQLQDLVDETPQIGEAVRAAVRLYDGIGRVVPVSLGGLVWILFGRLDANARDEFFEKFITGLGLDVETDPVYVLRRQLTRPMQAYERTPSQRLKLAWTIKAWNAYRNQRPVSRLSFTPREAFPVPI